MTDAAPATAPILAGATIVDLSHWNPETEANFVTAKENGCVGIIVKWIQNGVVDPKAIELTSLAFEAGIPLLGGYDFGTAKDDAAAFLAQMGADYGGDLAKRLLLLDAERYPSQMTVAGAEEFVGDIEAKEGRW